jgi:purine nucleoside permease
MYLYLSYFVITNLSILYIPKISTGFPRDFNINTINVDTTRKKVVVIMLFNTEPKAFIKRIKVKRTKTPTKM